MNILSKNLKSAVTNTIFSDIDALKGMADYQIMSPNKQQIISEPNFNKNKSLYLLIDITDIAIVKRVVNQASSKSIILLWYQELEDLHHVLSHIPFYEKEDKVVLLRGELLTSEAISKYEQILKTIFTGLTSIQPVVAISENVSYIKRATHIITLTREYREKMRFVLGNDLDDTLYGVRNRLLNLPNYISRPGYLQFKQAYGHLYKDKPAVIVASGPSLDKNIKVLKKYQDHALILCCDGSISSCVKHQVDPDIIGSVERIFLTYSSFYQNKTMPQNSVFFGPAVVRPETIDRFKDDFIGFFKKGDGYGNWLDKALDNQKGQLYCGTSVAHMLLSIAHDLGCSPIILTGQDLAYSNSGVSHTDSAEVKETADLSKVTVFLKDADGNDIASTPVWKNFHAIFESMIHEQNMNVIDATEGGAYINGTAVMTLEASLGQYDNLKKPQIKALVAQLYVDSDAASEHQYQSIVGIETHIDLYLKLKTRLAHALQSNRQSKRRLDKGLKTQAQLDKIYDSLEYVDQKIVKYIINQQLLSIYFQYPIYLAVEKINQLTATKYTLESISYNLNVHASLLDIFDHYTDKMLRVLYEQLMITLDNYHIDKCDYQEKYSQCQALLSDDSLTFEMK